MIKVEGKEIADYRKELENRKSDLPIWERKVLTCDEAAAYSGIGIARLRSMTMKKGCPFAIANGTQILIVREKFDAYKSHDLTITNTKEHFYGRGKEPDDGYDPGRKRRICHG